MQHARVQAIFNATDGDHGKTFIIGGDGRFFSAEATQIILLVAAANGAARAVVGQNGLLPKPAASNLIYKRRADGGFILSAKHILGGINTNSGL